LKGAFVGMNVIANSDFRYSDSAVQGRYRVRVPGWIRYDFNTGYRWKTRNTRWSHSVSLVLKNAFDREYAYGTAPTREIRASGWFAIRCCFAECPRPGLLKFPAADLRHESHLPSLRPQHPPCLHVCFAR